MKTKRKGRTVNADLGAYKDSCLDPLVFFAPPVLEPDSNDPGVQPRHLHQLLLAQEIAGQHGDVIVGNNVSNNTKCTNVTNPVNFDNSIIVNEEVLLRMATIHAYWDPVFQSVHLVSSLWWVVTLSRASGLGLCWKQAVKMVRCFSVRTVRPRWDRPLPLPWPRERPPLLQAILSQMLIFSGLNMSQSLELYVCYLYCGLLLTTMRIG